MIHKSSFLQYTGIKAYNNTCDKLSKIHVQYNLYSETTQGK